jgi:DNA replication protein DnaC
MAARLRHADVVILEELRYLPFSVNGEALHFHLIGKLSGRGVIIATHLSFSEWRAAFGDARMTTVLPDRLKHHWHRCDIVEAGNEWYRFKYRRLQQCCREHRGNR